MKIFQEFLQTRIALIDRGFIVAEGRVVYPTAEGVLVGFDDDTLHVILRGDTTATVFMRDAIRAIRALPPEAPAEAPAAEAPSAG